MQRKTADPAAVRVAKGTAAPGPAAVAAPTGPAAPVLRLQRVLGNAAVQRLLAQRTRAADGSGPVEPAVEEAIQASRGGGQGLDPGTRGSMEQAFGADFGGVRVHTGAPADGLSRSLGARAFTTGSDVFFRQGEFDPASRGGRELLAHELTHVVQQSGAPPAARRALSVGPADDAHEREAERIARRVAEGTAPGALGGAGADRVQRAPPEPAAEAAKGAADPAKAAEEKKEEKPPVPADVAKEAAAVLAGIGGTKLKQVWSAIQGQLTTPRDAAKKPSGTEKGYPGLWAADLVGKLRKLDAKGRGEVATAVLDAVGKSITGVEGSVFRDEFSTVLGARLRGNIEGGLPGFIALRTPILARFGSLKFANQYFDTLVNADFPSAASGVRGHGTLVNPELKKRLAKGAALLQARKPDPAAATTLLDLVEAGIGGVGGFNVRENRNHPSMSEHSFGFAVDIDAELNPNVKPRNFPNELMKTFTGEDVYKGAHSQAFRTGGTYDELLPHAEALREASDAFRDDFDSETAVKTAVQDYLAGEGLALADPKFDELWKLVTAKGKESARRKKAAEKISAEHTAANPPPAAPADTAVPAPVEEPAPAPVPAKGKKAKKAKKPKKPAPPPPPPLWSEAERLAGVALAAWSLFNQSQTKGKKVAASSVGSPGSLAAHGFLNLPAELIAALTASDGGGLQWLGAVKEGGTKDFMHFELKPADRPALPKDPAASAAAAVPAPAADEDADEAED